MILYLLVRSPKWHLFQVRNITPTGRAVFPLYSQVYLVKNRFVSSGPNEILERLCLNAVLVFSIAGKSGLPRYYK